MVSSLGFLGSCVSSFSKIFVGHRVNLQVITISCLDPGYESGPSSFICSAFANWALVL